MRRVVIVLGLLFGSLAIAGPSEARPERTSGRTVRSENVSVSFVSGDPLEAMHKAERLMVGAGGHVERSSGTASNSSLTARVPPSKVEDAIAGLRRISGNETSINRSTSDMTSSVRDYRNRLADLDLAEAALADAVASAQGDERRGLMLLFELAERERRSMESSVASYEQQSATAVINVSVSRAN